MVKVITLLKRKSGITLEEFSRHWLEPHAQLVLNAFPGTKRYVQNPIVSAVGQQESPFDGVAEAWFDDMESWAAAARFSMGEEGKEARDDAEEFLDTSKMIFFVVEERVIKE